MSWQALDVASSLQWELSEPDYVIYVMHLEQAEFPTTTPFCCLLPALDDFGIATSLRPELIVSGNPKVCEA